MTKKSYKIEEVLGKVKNRILRIGIELEGGWTKLPPGVAALEHDGSVRGLAHPPNGVLTQVGELPSPPLFADAGVAAKHDQPSWQAWLKSCYPHAVNVTCGLHVHLSFRSLLVYQRLMVPEFQKEVLRLFGEWGKENCLALDHPLWARLAGKSEYCQHRFEPELQSLRRDKGHNRQERGNRYTVINYCYGTHNTLECRLLPMMEDVRLAESAIQRFLDITNAFYVTHAVPEKPQRIEVVADEFSFQEEEFRACV